MVQKTHIRIIRTETHARKFEWPAIANRLIAHIHHLNTHPQALAI